MTPEQRRAERDAAQPWQVAYDIADPRRLRRVERSLRRVGERVHHSLFLCELGPAALQHLQRRLAAVIDRQADSIRYTPLCTRDRARTRHAGTSIDPTPEACWIA